MLAVSMLASCASAPAKPIRMVIAPFEAQHSDFRGEPVLSSRDTENCLQDRLAASGRFIILERRNLDSVIQAQRRGDAKAGSLAGADWVAYGTLEGTLQGLFDAPGSRCTAVVIVQLRVVRVDDGVIIYSNTHRGTAEGAPSSAEGMFLKEIGLLNEANRIAVSKLADDLIGLAR